jgi:hypothetical protein
MFYRKIITLCCKKHAENVYILSVQKGELFSAKPGGTLKVVTMCHKVREEWSSGQILQLEFRPTTFTDILKFLFFFLFLEARNLFKIIRTTMLSSAKRKEVIEIHLEYSLC